ncbi:acyclic terpene utilization AtuA family protein [Nonomuraea sp. NPDC049655]|uniref:acyclic terpene utilization AtuA family protein n=1 Tax=Nonomuraea sp. NPDC049655 TaxID=3364355 RepID=UPI0037AF959C
MLRIGTLGAAPSVGVVACGWHDSGPGPFTTGIKLIYTLGGPLPELPGLRIGSGALRGAEQIAAALLQGLDVVITEPACPAAPVVAAGMWHYGWTRRDVSALAGATVAGLALATQPGACVAEIGRDGAGSIDGQMPAESVRARVAAAFSGGRYRTPEVTVPLEAVRLSQDTPCRIRIARTPGLVV